MPLTTDVNVVKQRAPSLIVATVRARKADKVTLLFGDDNELILERRRQAALPDADPILRSFNLLGIPWRFSGSTGLYGRPEVRLLLAFLRVLADLSSSVDLYAVAASEVYDLGGEDLTAIVNSARRRNRSIWEVAEELTRQPGLLRLKQATRGALARLVEDLRRYSELAHERSAGEVLYAFLRGSGLLARLAATPSVQAEEALSNIARFFDIVRAQSALLASTAGNLPTHSRGRKGPRTCLASPPSQCLSRKR